MFYDDNLVQFKGTESFALYQNIETARETLKASGVGYTEEVWGSSSETVPNPWKVLVVDGVISLFFAKNDKLFKIVAWENYTGCLPNGIRTGMNIADAMELDSSLSYSEWNEDYESESGYWLEDDIDTKAIISISIFIREALDEDNFDYCEW